jgi:hypothetical protein
MKLMNQVCTLEQAKRLKELGVSQDSLYSWCGDETKRLMDNGKAGMAVSDWVYIDLTIPPNNQELDHRSMVPNAKPFAAAYNVAELGAMLPGKFQYMDFECFVDSVKYCKEYKWIAGVHTVWAHDRPVVAKKYFPANTEAQARAAMLIALLETEAIKVEEVNNRLLND